MKTLFNVLSASALIAFTLIVFASEDPNEKKNFLCDGDSCVTVQIDQYDETKDKEAVKELVESAPGLVQEQKKAELLNLFLTQTIQKITKPEHENQANIVNAENPIIAHYHADVVRSQDKAVGLVCYLNTDVKKMNHKSSVISLICATEKQEEKITGLLIEHVLNVSQKNDIPMVFSCLPEKAATTRKVFEDKKFECMSANNSICTYMKMSEGYIQKMKAAADIAEKEAESPFIAHLKKDNIEQIVQSKEPVILDICSSMCPPCRLMAPILKGLAEEYKGRYSFAKFNIEDNSEFINKIMQEHSLNGIPALIFIRDGKIVGTSVGYISKETLVEKINSLFKK